MESQLKIDLSGKVAIVTGSGQGLGLAFAKALSAAGASVIVNDINQTTLDSAVQEISASGAKVFGVKASVGSSETGQLLVDEAIRVFGRLDVLCTNAGVLRDKVLWNMTDEDFDQVIHTHLRGTFTCARAAVKHMRASNTAGRLILVSSIAGQRGNFGQGNYAAAKAGIAAMARSWALECLRSGITVNAIVPAAMTQMVATIPSMAPYVKAMEQGEPLPTKLRSGWGLGVPEDVSPLLVFLASEYAQKITGQCIGIGGDKLTLWSHPDEIKSAYKQGGWDAEQIATVWENSIGSTLETFGIPMPN
jgi:NAD(P)-dependent dehydrogenase (short-subunit alcohol dehydrogenase family)